MYMYNLELFVCSLDCLEFEYTYYCFCLLNVCLMRCLMNLIIMLKLFSTQLFFTYICT
jgi:hypothetical protein